MIPPLTDRISLLEHVNERFPGGVGVEVGVAGGHFTRQILATWKTIGHLSAIDAWKHFDGGYEDACNLDQPTQDARYERVLLDFKDEPRVGVIRGMSVECAGVFPDQSVDFIYLDANHSYAAVKADLKSWWKALKPGGIFAGHDYCNGGPSYEVKKAVDEFSESLKIPVYTTVKEFSRAEGIYGSSWEGVSFALEKIIKKV